MQVGTAADDEQVTEKGKEHPFVRSNKYMKEAETTFPSPVA